MTKLLTVTGNSGKRVFSWFLANRLAADGAKALLVDTECGVPMAQLLVPTNEKADTKSLGRLLSAPVQDQKLVLQNMISFDHNKNLGLLSYAPGESEQTYPAISRADLETCFACFSDLVDTVVVRTQGTPNGIDRYALAQSDAVFCITTADVCGLAYRQRYPNLGAVHLLLANNPYNSLEDMRRTFPSPLKYTIPHCKALLPLYNGTLLTELTPPKPYAKLIERLIWEVLKKHE